MASSTTPATYSASCARCFSETAVHAKAVIRPMAQHIGNYSSADTDNLEYGQGAPPQAGIGSQTAYLDLSAGIYGLAEAGTLWCHQHDVEERSVVHRGPAVRCKCATCCFQDVQHSGSEQLFNSLNLLFQQLAAQVVYVGPLVAWTILGHRCKHLVKVGALQAVEGAAGSKEEACHSSIHLQADKRLSTARKPCSCAAIFQQQAAIARWSQAAQCITSCFVCFDNKDFILAVPAVVYLAAFGGEPVSLARSISESLRERLILT